MAGAETFARDMVFFIASLIVVAVGGYFMLHSNEPSPCGENYDEVHNYTGEKQ